MRTGIFKYYSPDDVMGAAPATGVKRIIIAGGGTGGHIFPAIAIANALKKFAPQTEILFVGAKGKMEMEKVPLAGYQIRGIDIAGFNRSSLLKNISLPLKLVKSFFQVSNIFKDFRPDAVIGVGGYSSFPVLKFAQGKGIPSFIHESNSFAGKTNIMVGKKATKVFTATEGMEQFFPAGKIMITGNPVRHAIVENKIPKELALNFFKLDKSRKVVLSIGGSLGAQSINDAILAHIDEFEKNGLQLIWQTGKPFFETAKAAVSDRENVWVGDFITQMEYAYAAADIVISRSGAMAIAELCIVEKPVVFVPYPFAAEDHQTVNAKVLVNRDAALMVTNDKAKEELVSGVVALAKDNLLQEKLIANISKLAVKDADEVVAREVLKLIDK